MLTDTSGQTWAAHGDINRVSGEYTSTVSDVSTSNVTQSGWNSTSSYDFDKESSTQDAYTESGNARSVSGYIRNGTQATASTASEYRIDGTLESTFVEILTEDMDYTLLGNNWTGDYTLIGDGTRTANLWSEGDRPSGSFYVTETSSGTFDRDRDGNFGTGDYTLDETSSTGYDFTLTTASGASTLGGLGTLTATVSESGNDYEGTFDRDEWGTDGYTLNGSGVDYAEEVIGAETYAIDVTGNAANGTSTTTVTGSGSYDRTTSGVGAVYSSGSDIYDYTMTEESDSLAGLFDRTDAGTNRYGLVQTFEDISGTAGGGVAGHLHFLPVGRPIVDPNPISIGFALGLAEGGFSEVGSMVSGLWGLVSTRPDKTAIAMYEGVLDLISTIRNEGLLEAAATLDPELYKLVSEFGQLGNRDAGYLVGRVGVKYGSMFIGGAGATKILTKLREIKRAAKAVEQAADVAKPPISTANPGRTQPYHDPRTATPSPGANAAGSTGKSIKSPDSSVAPAPARGNPLRTTGATNGVPVPGGQGLGKLAGKELKVTQGNLAEVEAHLMEFAKRQNSGVHFPENEMMLQRLRDAVRDGKPISGADLAFYTHELHELKNMARLMKDGAMTFDEAYAIAHPGALGAFGNSPFSVYHPDVIKALNAQTPGYFNNNWLKFWGIE